MPEQPQEPKRVPIPAPPAPEPMPAVPYAELHCCTNFSFLEGASHADELVARAAELGYTALAVTDRNSLAGMVRAHVAAKEAGLKLVVGAAIFPVDAAAVLLWATDRAAYGRLSQLLTVGRRSAPKGECHLTFDDVARHSEGLLAGVLLGRVRRPILHPTPLEQLRDYRDLFHDRCYAGAASPRGQEDRRWLQEMLHLRRAARVPLIAANDPHHPARRRRPLHDVLTAVRHGCTVAELGDRRFANAE